MIFECICEIESGNKILLFLLDWIRLTKFLLKILLWFCKISTSSAKKWDLWYSARFSRLSPEYCCRHHYRKDNMPTFSWFWHSKSHQCWRILWGRCIQTFAIRCAIVPQKCPETVLNFEIFVANSLKVFTFLNFLSFNKALRHRFWA